MIFNLGSINIDHVYQTPHIVMPGETLASTDYNKVLGGKGANQSIAIARAGGSVMHIGGLNRSDQAIVEQLQADGIDCQHIGFSAYPSGHAIIQVSADGENAIVLFAGANHQIDLETLTTGFSAATAGDWFLTQNETNGVKAAIESAKQQGLKVAFNPAPMSDDVCQINPKLIDLLVVNEVEASQLSGESEMAQILSYFEQHWSHTDVLVTLGAEGVCCLTGGRRINIAAKTVNVVDTTAAGDTFVGYFLAHYSQGVAMEQAVENAVSAAAMTVTQLGASSSIPKQLAVTQFFQN